MIKTGIHGLDQMLGGGLTQGRNILLSGPCGSGKTTLAMQFAYQGACTREPALYVTLEESKDKMYADMEKFGFDLKRAEAAGTFHMIGGHIGHIGAQMRKVDAFMPHLIQEIEEVVKEKGIQRVVVDSVNLFTMLARNDGERRKALALLCNALSRLGCTSILTSETKEGTMDLSRFGMEEFVVDGVIVLYLVREGPRFAPGIVVRKMRGMDHDKEIRVCQITRRGVVVYPKETMFGKF